MRIFAQSTRSDMKKITPYIVGIVALILLIGCQPKTHTQKIKALKKQVEASAKTLKTLEEKDLPKLQSEFFACDTMLQHLHPEEIDEIFPQLQLVDAYILQFKQTAPAIKADMDSTLIQLDNLKSDIETHYLSDSLATVYIAAEAQHVDLLSNQVQYFKDRFGSCKKDLNDISSLGASKKGLDDIKREK